MTEIIKGFPHGPYEDIPHRDGESRIFAPDRTMLALVGGPEHRAVARLFALAPGMAFTLRQLHGLTFPPAGGLEGDNRLHMRQIITGALDGLPFPADLKGGG